MGVAIPYAADGGRTAEHDHHAIKLDSKPRLLAVSQAELSCCIAAAHAAKRERPDSGCSNQCCRALHLCHDSVLLPYMLDMGGGAATAASACRQTQRRAEQERQHKVESAGQRRGLGSQRKHAGPDACAGPQTDSRTWPSSQALTQTPPCLRTNHLIHYFAPPIAWSPSYPPTPTPFFTPRFPGPSYTPTLPLQRSLPLPPAPSSLALTAPMTAPLPPPVRPLPRHCRSPPPLPPPDPPLLPLTIHHSPSLVSRTC